MKPSPLFSLGLHFDEAQTQMKRFDSHIRLMEDWRRKTKSQGVRDDLVNLRRHALIIPCYSRYVRNSYVWVELQYILLRPLEQLLLIGRAPQGRGLRLFDPILLWRLSNLKTQNMAPAAPLWKALFSPCIKRLSTAESCLRVSVLCRE